MVLRMAHAIASYIGFGEDSLAPVSTLANEEAEDNPTRPSVPHLTVVQPAVQENTLTENKLGKWRRHPQLRDYQPTMPAEERAARHEAVRGLYAAHAGAMDVARKHFMIAARCNQVDLTAVPGFWNLTRGQMQVAVNAYEQVGRYRDGAALDAHIATIFRPSLVGSKLTPIVPRENRDKAANT